MCRSPTNILIGEDYDRIVRALRPPSEYPEHNFEECCVCGRLEWVSSSKKGKREIKIFESDGPCGRCQQVSARAPEITDWVIDVVTKQIKSKG